MTGWERLNPRLVLVGVTWAVGPLLVAGATLVFTGPSLPALITLSSLVLTCLVVAGVLVLRWATTRYRVTPDAVETRSGLVFRRRRSAAVDRIRAVDVTARPLHRLVGLATVVVATAEGSLRLDGVTRAQARALRDRLRPSGAKVRLAAFDRSWLRYGPLTAWSVGGVGVVVGGAYRLLDSLGVKPYELGPVRDGYFALVGLPPFLAIAFSLLAVVVVGACGSTAWFVETWWDFRLSREGDTFRVRRGLVTTRSLTVDRARVRGVQVTEPLLLRAVGAARTNAIAVGLGGHEDRSAAASSALLPPAPLALASSVATEALGSAVLEPGVLSDVPWRRHPRAALCRHPRAALRRHPRAALCRHPRAALRRHPRAALRRRLLRVPLVVLPPTAILVVLGWWLTPILIHAALTVGLLCLLAGTWLAFDAYRALGHALTPEFVVMRSGTFARRTVALRREGVIGWQLSRSPFQRRAGLATLTFATAAGVHAYRVRDIAVKDAVHLAQQSSTQLISSADPPR